VAVRVPGVAVKPAGVLPRLPEAGLGQHNNLRKELVWFAVSASKHEFFRIIRTLTTGAEIQQSRAWLSSLAPGGSGHACSAHGDEAAEEVNVAPLKSNLFAPSQTGVYRRGEKRAKLGKQNVMDCCLLLML